MQRRRTISKASTVARAEATNAAAPPVTTPITREPNGAVTDTGLVVMPQHSEIARARSGACQLTFTTYLQRNFKAADGAAARLARGHPNSAQRALIDEF